MAAEGIVEGDAVSAIASPKLPRDLPGVLTTQQVEALLKTSDTPTPVGLRDAAMLELLYASGARISSLALNVESISWSSAWCACGARSKGASFLCIVVRLM
ncbi:MAG: tyrosine-type recombinase/integrase [Collinsella sp.]